MHLNKKEVQVISNPFEELLLKIEELKALVLNSTSNRGDSNQSPGKEIIDRATLCKRLGITEPTAIRHQKRGKIPFMQIGSSIRYDWEAVVRALECKKKNPRERVNE